MFEKTTRKDFECFHHEEIINVRGDRNVLPILNIMQCVDVLKTLLIKNITNLKHYY